MNQQSDSPESADALLSLKEMAARLPFANAPQKTRETRIRVWVSRKKNPLPCIQPGGPRGKRWFRPSAVMRWLEGSGNVVLFEQRSGQDMMGAQKSG